ncbi:DUF1269 domain-containing protein [Conexibacter sp. CPCC 206217]|uniref:DUF1269 domain-containing protein n=1 Tax=Conexibacter sp. CPCC 206217 TaxID=3064574 RepID=UPI002715DBBC|nr:DUF1269 domain-containing protein [Conexibacter sp. CPCC 206217]MDO8213818.1 DUF1269 domain-containing protein [Conexibacter sp. CPCC 206217]
MSETFVLVGAYEREADAQADYEAVRELHAAGLVGTYDAAVIHRDGEHHVHVRRHEKPTQHGAWTGLAAGALLGILWPPSLIGTALAGGAFGGLVGHFWRGLPRKELKELGETLDEGQAALFVVGEATVEEAVRAAVKRADKIVSKELKAEAKELQKALKEAEQEQAAQA